MREFQAGVQELPLALELSISAEMENVVPALLWHPKARAHALLNNPMVSTRQLLWLRVT